MKNLFNAVAVKTRDTVALAIDAGKVGYRETVFGSRALAKKLPTSVVNTIGENKEIIATVNFGVMAVASLVVTTKVSTKVSESDNSKVTKYAMGTLLAITGIATRFAYSSLSYDVLQQFNFESDERKANAAKEASEI